MKLGVIGAGNMGRAILSGILASGLITKDDIVASNRTEADRDKTEKLGVNVTGDNTDVARAECVILAVKPAKLADVIHESLMGAAGTVSGASPAWVYMLIEAMADGAVRDGMPRAQAYKFAAQAVQGAAKMVLESGLHPGELKDQVTSPGGTTIEAVRVLEERGFRGAVIDAMGACTAKNDCIAAKAASAVATKKEAQAQEPGALSNLFRALKG